MGSVDFLKVGPNRQINVWKSGTEEPLKITGNEELIVPCKTNTIQ